MGKRAGRRVVLGVLALSLWTVAASAKEPVGTAQKPRIVYFPARGVVEHGEQKLVAKMPPLVYHGGALLVSPSVVFIFWGPSFANPASPDHAYALALQAYRKNFGLTPQWADIAAYGMAAPVALSSGTPDWFDTAVPPVNVTDAIAQAEVGAYLSLWPVSYKTVYELVLPITSYSSVGSATSCGGPSLSYCAYHSWIGSDPTAVKYSVQPYPSCTGCRIAGWTPTQNQEHFVCHETREAATDPTGLGWWDSGGNEADDKCAWTPAPYLSGGSGYQYEWSNASSSCIP